MKKSIAIIGLGKFGMQLAIELSDMGHDILAIDRDSNLVNQLIDVVKSPICADINDGVTLSKLGLDSVETAVVCMSENLEASILAIMALLENGVENIWVKAGNDSHAHIYKTLGATRVFIPEKESATNMARCLSADNIEEFFELSDRIGIAKLIPRPEWIGHDLVELSLRRRFGVNIVAVEKDGEISLDIDPQEKLTEQMTLWIATSKKSASKLQR